MAHQEENAFGLVEGAIACTGIVGGLLGEKLQNGVFSLTISPPYSDSFCVYQFFRSIISNQSNQEPCLNRLKNFAFWRFGDNNVRILRIKRGSLVGIQQIHLLATEGTSSKYNIP